VGAARRLARNSEKQFPSTSSLNPGTPDRPKDSSFNFQVLFIPIPKKPSIAKTPPPAAKATGG
jgi:hypothetical protein